MNRRRDHPRARTGERTTIGVSSPAEPDGGPLTCRRPSLLPSPPHRADPSVDPGPRAPDRRRPAPRRLPVHRPGSGTPARSDRPGGPGPVRACACLVDLQPATRRPGGHLAALSSPPIQQRYRPTRPTATPPPCEPPTWPPLARHGSTRQACRSRGGPGCRRLSTWGSRASPCTWCRREWMSQAVALLPASAAAEPGQVEEVRGVRRGVPRLARPGVPGQHGGVHRVCCSRGHPVGIRPALAGGDETRVDGRAELRRDRCALRRPAGDGRRRAGRPCARRVVGVAAPVVDVAVGVATGAPLPTLLAVLGRPWTPAQRPSGSSSRP